MSLLRSILFTPLAILITAIAATMLVLLLWAPASWRIGVIRVWRRVFMALVSGVLGIRYSVKGREYLPEEPVVILSKHQSAWETVALQDVFAPRWLSFAYKRELKKVPFVGWSLMSLPMISVNRGGGRDALASLAENGGQRLKEGHHVLIFPEGTRTAPGERRKYKPGGAHLAVATGASVIPVAHNAGEFWPRNAFVKRAGQVTISIGPAIDPAGKTSEEVIQQTEAWIEGEMLRISAAKTHEPRTV